MAALTLANGAARLRRISASPVSHLIPLRLMRTSVHNLLADQGHRCKGDRFVSGLLADLAYVRQGRSRCLWCCPGVVAVALGRPPCRARSGHDLQIRRSGAWRGGREPDHGRPSGAGLDRARQHGSSRIRPQVAAAPAAPPQAAADRATRGIVMRTGRMTAASAHGYIVVSRGQLWHRRPVRGIEAHLDPSFTTEPPARIPTSPHDRQRTCQGCCPRWASTDTCDDSTQ